MHTGINIPRPEYPRPDFERTDWLNLNGEWEFEFDDENTGERNQWYNGVKFSKKIVVPYCYQSRLSGIDNKGIHDYVWYKRKFNLPQNLRGKNIYLNFGAVDNYAKVWVNGVFAGANRGGYTPFKFDITNLIREEDNVLTIKVEDDSRCSYQLRGKQTWDKENFGCWYTRITGIWQTVWLEATSFTHIERIKITPNVDTRAVNFEFFITGNISECELNTLVSYSGHNIAGFKTSIHKGMLSFSLDISSDEFQWKILTWDPSQPNLYDVKFELINNGVIIDSVKSYFGMRKISTKDGKVLLNNQPIYQKLVLEQGYFDGGLLTAENDECFINDIKIIKELGFNGVRIHQKVEDPRFLYWADKLGLLVWGEMASAYEFNDIMITENTRHWQKTIERDYNHPSIIVWTLMNESWGVPNILTDERQQYHTASLYYMAKSYDSTRLVISNDGWEHTYSDLATFHDYTQDGGIMLKRLGSKDSIINDSICSIGDNLGAKYLFAEGYNYSGQPILISECCGVAFNEKAGWGYGKGVNSQEEFLNRYMELMEAIYKIEHIAGFCITQLTDVEQEVNGLLTIDRKFKLDAARFANIMRND